MIDPHPTRTHLLQLLRRSRGATLHDLQRRTGLSRSALRQHLTLLERDGLIRERLARGRTGRPPIVYEPAATAERGLSESYATVLGAVFRAVGEQGEEQVRRVVEATAAEIAGRHRDIVSIPKLEARISAALAVLLEDPQAAEVRRAGRGYEIILHDCPFLTLAAEFNEVCDITRELLTRLVGARVEQREWLVRGDPRCSFVLKPGRTGRSTGAAPAPLRPLTVSRRSAYG